MRFILQRRGLERYFQDVFGAPCKKEDALCEILAHEGKDASSTVFVGDAVNDWRAARAAGVRFIGRQLPGEPDRFSSLEGIEAVVIDLHELAGIVRESRC
jgi:phosphoglycolate phosphatase-like HAD superfamily hydrolase